MMKKDECVYIIFEERPLSCDPDYDDDGFIVVWDSDEVGRNLTTCQLIEEIGKCDDDIYQKVMDYISQELSLNYSESSEDLDNLYFREVFEFIEKQIGGGIFYKFHYQTVPSVKGVYKTPISAKKEVEYYNDHRSYTNKYHYVKYRLQGD